MSQNLLDALKDPFASDFPTFLEEELPPPRLALSAGESSDDEEHSHAGSEDGRGDEPKASAKRKAMPDVPGCCAFSARGSHLALGSSSSGRVLVRDMLTRSTVASIQCHSRSVTSVKFLPGHGGRLLLTTAADGDLCIHDLESGACRLRWRFARPVARASVAPDGRCLICLAAEPAAGEKAPVAGASDPDLSGPWPLLTQLDLDGAANRLLPAVSGPPAKCTRLKWEMEPREKKARAPALTGVFSADGSVCFVGGFAGRFHVFSSESGELLRDEAPIPSRKTAFIRRMVRSKVGRVVLAQSSDKVIHMLEVDRDNQLAHRHDLQDSVEGTRWSACTVSPDGEYVIAASSKTHTLHVWNVLGRHMAKLIAPANGLVRDIQWHPCRPLVVSLGRDGQSFLWSTHRSEAWSAFAPNFVQLEENIEYHEREDEFDRNPRGVGLGAMQGLGPQDAVRPGEPAVDIVSHLPEDPALAEVAFAFSQPA